MLIPAIIIGVIVLVLALLYNGLVSARNRAQEAWSDIDVQLKRRYDLIPNLINTVKGYAAHEEKVLTAVTNARTEAMQQGGGIGTQSANENQLTDTLKSLFAVAENYPDLKANQNFLELQQELSDTENKIMASRRFYNSSVMDLNTKIESFPTNIFASLFGFAKKEFFELTNEAAKEPVAVQF
jgi:LemA protein